MARYETQAITRTEGRDVETRKMDLALVRPLFDRPELPISYPRQIAVQAEAECGTDSYRKR
ncbi:hypothetical protein BO85DRAFT_450261 [Aspergillus piperis CBS 112811]|uniref:Uncharacterized protein n=1 Tax=Aspergillus piperis CBS 112811 TaxID=1448313 RepID=A0A8G1R087_9EURO|nr:hypothetical protein BO85DRAFT_450261 [Aspergillus piperis CBS 112811]RAH56868.1 hypothetical protein BO85DRAFT_450261 [Aspergillus piperis CBS 112811]